MEKQEAKNKDNVEKIIHYSKNKDNVEVHVKDLSEGDMENRSKELKNKKEIRRIGIFRINQKTTCFKNFIHNIQYSTF